MRANGLRWIPSSRRTFLIRIPAFARLAADLRRRLDDGPGVAVLRGVPVDPEDEEAAGIVAWGLGNYLGRPVRTGPAPRPAAVHGHRPRAANTDPTRIGASARLSRMHSDNGCLEPRPPAYIGLLCVQNAATGGDSTLVSADTLHREIVRQRPDLLPWLYRDYHFRPPQAAHLAGRGADDPQADLRRGCRSFLNVHYAGVMIDPGMEIAGLPNRRSRFARRSTSSIRCWSAGPGLAAPAGGGGFPADQHLATLHGRLGYSDAPDGGVRRVLQRVWLWRVTVSPATTRWRSTSPSSRKRRPPMMTVPLTVASCRRRVPPESRRGADGQSRLRTRLAETSVAH